MQIAPLIAQSEDLATRVTELVAGWKVRAAALEEQNGDLASAADTAAQDTVARCATLGSDVVGLLDWREEARSEVEQRLATLAQLTEEVEAALQGLHDRCQALSSETEASLSSTTDLVTNLISDVEGGIEEPIAESVTELVGTIESAIEELFAETRDVIGGMADTNTTFRVQANEFRSVLSAEAVRVQDSFSQSGALLIGVFDAEFSRFSGDLAGNLTRLSDDASAMVERAQATVEALETTSSGIESATQAVATATDAASSGLMVAVGAFESVQRLCDEITDAF